MTKRMILLRALYRRMVVDIRLGVVLTFVFGVLKCDGGTPPGKPVLMSCRSPEKETFSCWWAPGDHGGLPTAHRLFYTKENLDGTFECPDYRSAGDHSCHFDRNHTSIWVSYWLTVVAVNTLGNTSSDTLEVDVVEIVQPSPPENVSVSLEILDGNPFLHVRWRPPSETDPGSGWVTVVYQLRVKTAGDETWEEYLSGQQAHFNIHSLHSGERYMVQVRCKLDHGHWSQWGDVTHLQLPNYALKQRLLWTLIAVTVFVLITAVMFLLIMKRKKLKGWLLPTIPGPKIHGFDPQSFKNRYSEQVLYGLIPQGVPPALALRDHSEEFLAMWDSGDGLAPGAQKAHTRNRSLIIPGFFQLSRLTCSGGEGDHARAPALAPWASLEDGGPEERSPSEGRAEPGAGETAGGGSEPTGYVGAGAAEQGVQEAGDGTQQEYSRVSALNRENMLVLEKENISLTSSCREKGCPVNATDQTNVDKKTKVCSDLLDNGYVDSAPALP